MPEQGIYQATQIVQPCLVQNHARMLFQESLQTRYLIWCLSKLVIMLPNLTAEENQDERVLVRTMSNVDMQCNVMNCNEMQQCAIWTMHDVDMLMPSIPRSSNAPLQYVLYCNCNAMHCNVQWPRTCNVIYSQFLEDPLFHNMNCNCGDAASFDIWKW